eukprot:COSAG01_NODE_4732_length_4777_cov_1.971624_6_plen_177_part_00
MHVNAVTLSAHLSTNDENSLAGGRGGAVLLQRHWDFERTCTCFVCRSTDEESRRLLPLMDAAMVASATAAVWSQRARTGLDVLGLQRKAQGVAEVGGGVPLDAMEVARAKASAKLVSGGWCDRRQCAERLREAPRVVQPTLAEQLRQDVVCGSLARQLPQHACLHCGWALTGGGRR